MNLKTEINNIENLINNLSEEEKDKFFQNIAINDDIANEDYMDEDIV